MRAVHRRDPEATRLRLEEAASALKRAQSVLAPFPSVAYAGFLHDAEKEYAEARLTAALVGDEALPSPELLGVELPAFLHGLAEAATELRRHLLDRLRDGEVDEAERLLSAMEDVYDVLVAVDYPDAMTAGLRRATDALRGVLERSRADLTVTVVQERLRRSLGQHGKPGGSG